MILETERLALREMTQDDYPALCAILQDPEVMTAYEHAFSDEEVQRWLDQQIHRYRQDGFGLWAVLLKSTGDMIGQCGITMQDWDGQWVLDVGYLFRKDCWHKGYATEAAVACKQYAFQTLKADRIYSIIRDTNLPSQKVAMRNGMSICGQFVKHYYGVDMPHLVFCAAKDKDTHPQ